jgi:hypothetical protein
MPAGFRYTVSAVSALAVMPLNAGPVARVGEDIPVRSAASTRVKTIVGPILLRFMASSIIAVLSILKQANNLYR